MDLKSVLLPCYQRQKKTNVHTHDLYIDKKPEQVSC